MIHLSNSFLAGFSGKCRHRKYTGKYSGMQADREAMQKDRDALRGDWRMVGKDMKKAMDQFEKENARQRR